MFILFLLVFFFFFDNPESPLISAKRPKKNSAHSALRVEAHRRVPVGEHLAAGVVAHLEELPGPLSEVAAGFHN